MTQNLNQNKTNAWNQPDELAQGMMKRSLLYVSPPMHQDFTEQSPNTFYSPANSNSLMSLLKMGTSAAPYLTSPNLKDLSHSPSNATTIPMKAATSNDSPVLETTLSPNQKVGMSKALGSSSGNGSTQTVTKIPPNSDVPVGIDLGNRARQFASDFGDQLYYNWGGLGTGFYNAVSPIGTGIGIALSQYPSTSLADLNRGASYLAKEVHDSSAAIYSHPELVGKAASHLTDSFDQKGAYGEFIGGAIPFLVGAGIKAPITGPVASSAYDQALIDRLVAQRLADGNATNGKATYANSVHPGGLMTPARQSIPDPGGNRALDIHAETQVLDDISGRTKPLTIAIDQVPCPGCKNDLADIPPGSRVVVPELTLKPGGSPKTAAKAAATGKSTIQPRTLTTLPPTKTKTALPIPTTSTISNNNTSPP